ncbi:hypothetical protein ACIBQ1_55325 [Nonomuraea sp. NPDC050153]|uniref:hypothetical protein n=1 Tax=Nonomuraea sp. NPDC050153 TaxID=3364359 RepID=UPI0037AA6CA9
MSTNERDWFSPRNDPRREDDQAPPPPSVEPPPGLAAPSGHGNPPPAQGQRSGHGLPPVHDPRLDEEPSPETAPIPRVPSAGDLPGHHGRHGGRGTPPPSHDALEGRPGGPPVAMGRPDAPHEPMGWPGAHQEATGRPSAPQEALEWPSAPQQGPAHAQSPQSPTHAQGPADAQGRPYAPGPAHAQGPAQGHGPAHARGPAHDQGPAHAQGPAYDQGPAHAQGPTHDQGPAHARGPQRRPGLPPRPTPQQPRARHAAQADQQVWPPASREPVGGATQPLPAVQVPMSMSPQQGATTPVPRHQNPLPPDRAPQEAHEAPGPETASGAPQDSPPGERREAAPGGRRKRTVLVAVAAVVVSLVTVGVQSYDGYLFFEKTTTKETKETVVPVGQAARVKNIEWRATVTRIKMPEGLPYGPEVTALRVDITKKVLDAGSATKTGLFTEAKLEDRTGRTWVVNIDQQTSDRPTDRLEVGKEYKILAAAVVPTAVANEVELSLRPSNYRSDTPTADLFKRDTVSKLEGDVDVLRFKRR